MAIPHVKAIINREKKKIRLKKIQAITSAIEADTPTNILPNSESAVLRSEFEYNPVRANIIIQNGIKKIKNLI